MPAAEKPRVFSCTSSGHEGLSFRGVSRRVEGSGFTGRRARGVRVLQALRA